MILITCSGEIGNTVYVNGTFRGAVGSPDLIRVLADPQKILSGYLYTYLRSAQARALIQQKTYGAVIPHIEAHHVFDLPIPRLEPEQEQRIHVLVEQAAELRVQANASKLQAEKMAAQLLKVQLNIPVSRKRIITIPAGVMNDRLEATYHVAQVSAASLAASPFPLVPLGDLLVEIFYLGKLHRVFVNNPIAGIPLLSISDAQKAKLSSDKYISKTLSRNIKQAILKSGWVLISRSGTPGLVIYTRREMEGLAATDHLIRIITDHNKLLPGYLFSFLSSLVGKDVLIGSSHGSVQLELPPEYIMLVNIPLPPLEYQRDIHNLIEQYGEDLTKASELEDQAQQFLLEALEYK